MISVKTKEQTQTHTYTDTDDRLGSSLNFIIIIYYCANCIHLMVTYMYVYQSKLHFK